jgi:hypothetical protein
MISSDKLNELSNAFCSFSNNEYLKDYVAYDSQNSTLHKPGPKEFLAEIDRSTYINDFYIKIPIL